MSESKKFKHQFAPDTSGEWGAYGFYGWRPVMALPFYVGWGLKKAKCGCGRVFKNEEDFFAHYLYKAIWEFESPVLPVEWKDLSSKKS